MIDDANSSFHQKACVDLLVFLVHRDCYYNFLWNNVHQTHPLVVKYEVDDLCV